MRLNSTLLAHFPVALVLAGALGACKSGEEGSAAAGESGISVNPSKVQARAKTPPPSTASHQASIGKGNVSVRTANTSTETDSEWVEQLDIDGDGTLEQTELLWDDEDKVLFAYAETDVPCEFGGTAVVAILVGVNGQGNPRGRPAGSGFYAAYLDDTECGADEAGLYGCKFDAAGKVTAWGEAVMDEAGDTIVLTAERY